MGHLRHRGEHEIENRLRTERPALPEELVDGISRRTARGRRSGALRFALAGVLTATMLVALASVGGISYAASSVTHAAKVIKKAVAPSGQDAAVSVFGISAGGDQYRPGYGFGDPNHNHTGPPGLHRQGAASGTPPIEKARRTADGRAVIVRTTIVIDEQAAFFLQVLDQRGDLILLTQESARGGSKIGSTKLEGKQSKTLRFTVLVPRAIPIMLRIPAHLVREDQAYRIRVVAIDPNGNKSVIIIPFRVVE